MTRVNQGMQYKFSPMTDAEKKEHKGSHTMKGKTSNKRYRKATEPRGHGTAPVTGTTDVRFGSHKRTKDEAEALLRDALSRI